MIMLAKVVSYGGNSVRYALEKENAKTVKVNNMPDGLDPTAIWYMMKHHCQYHQAERTVGRKLERFMTTFVLSPSKEESANFTMADWSNLQDEALEVLDSVGLTPNGFSNEIKTNFTNSMNVGGLHSDSKSGTLHLHIDCCRVDMEGNTNDVHDIHIRAMKAAEIINMRHGWEQPQEIRNMRKVELAEDCENTLKDMQQFNIDRYFNLLRMKGYEVKPRYDKQRKLVGYTVGKNASVFKASEIGRKYMVSKIEATWQKLHPQPTQVKAKPVYPSVASTPRPVRPVVQTPTTPQPKAQPHTKTPFHINIGDDVKKIWIPNSVKDVFTNEVQIPEDNDIATTENVAHVAMLLFAGYIDAATSMSESCGGGGSSPSSGWGKKDDEDDWKFAHRCAQMAHSMCKPKPRSRSFHRQINDNMAIRKSKINIDTEERSDFDNMMNDVENEVEEQQAEDGLVSRVPELKQLSEDIDKATNTFINATLELESAIQQYQRAETQLGGAVTTIGKKVDTINQHIDKAVENAPTQLKVSVKVNDADWQKVQELFTKERQWMTAQMQMHIREVNSMFADERKKVRERYKEYEGCYLGRYAQWFFWFFFTIGIFVVAGGIGIIVAQNCGK